MLNNSRSYSNILSIAMFAAGAVILLWVTYDFVSRYRPQWLGRDPAQTPIVTVASNQQTPADYNVSAIVAAHIFGQPVREQPVVEQAPETNLKISLLGVLSSEDEQYARALIRVGSKRLSAYAVGNQVDGTDAKIYKVESQRVILDRSGKYESLAMVRKGLEGLVMLKTRSTEGQQSTGAMKTDSNEGKESTGAFPF